MTPIQLRTVLIDPRHSYIVKSWNQTAREPSLITPLYRSRRSIGSRIGLGMVLATGLLSIVICLAGWL